MTNWKVVDFGTSGYLNLSNSISLNPPTMTIELGFKFDGYTPDRQLLFGKGASSGDSFYFYTYRSVNNINDFVVYNNGTRNDQQLNDIFSPGVWYTLDLTLDGEQIRIYENGMPINSWTRSITFRGNMNDLQIGACSCGGYFFNGSLSFFRLYSRALSAAEILQNYGAANPISKDLSLWLQFDRTIGSEAIDISGNGNNAQIEDTANLDPPNGCDWYPVVLLAKLSDQSPYSLTQDIRPSC